MGFFPFRHGRYAANEYKYLNWYVQEKAAILMNIHHLTCNFIRISFGSYPNLIRVLLEFLLNFYSYLIRISTFMWNLSHRNRTPFTHLHEIFRKFMWNLSQVYMRFFISLCEIFCKLKKYMYLCIGFGKSPDGGIGRRAGLKHQCRKASRFEPGSGYYKSLVSLWFTRDFSFSTCTKSVLYNNVMRKVYFYVFSPLRFIFN